MPTAHLAIDLGASSGRAMVGVLDSDSKKVEVHEVHRFDHHPCPTPAGPVWDFTGIWLHIIEGIKLSGQWCRGNEVELKTIGVDAWGVDWSLVGKSGELLALPHCYRDPQNVAAMENVLEIVGGKQALYDRNGIQLMPINSLFQVAARNQQEPELFGAAHRLLFVPDIFHFWLSGEMATERTIASTSSMLSLESGEWDIELMEMLGIPSHVLGDIVDPGTRLGTLREEVAVAAGITEPIEIVVPGSHDTASAIAAVPHTSESQYSNWAYLSSGTWSLLGAEINESFASKESCEAPFTNELGLSGTTRFLKNIGGLWLVQELRRERVEQGEEITFGELADQARNATPYRTLIDPNAPQFAAPGDMAEKIRAFARDTNQPEPETLGELVRCCLDSLALCYRQTINRLESVLDTKVEVLHIVGGGTKNELLSEITAATMQRPVVCGPVEATAIGNVLTQAMGSGELDDLDEIRQVVMNSFDPKIYSPSDLDEALQVSDEVFEFYRSLVN